ncbi:MAG: Ig-like domain-containing protein [Polyangiaceae bacterium]
MKKPRLPFLLPLLAATATLALAEEPARATGMQGHMYMAMCAAERVTDPRLRAIFDSAPLYLANGAFIVDSGYTMPDHDQGEIPHWEGYIDAYLQLIRQKHAPPYDTPEASQHIATLMGMAAHGITDSTFDTLIYARAEQVEPSDMSSFDTAMDIFLVADMPRYFIPDLANDPVIHSEAFTAVNHPISEKDVKSAASTARSGIAAVSEFLYKGADEYGLKYPWARAHFTDPRTPGSYAFGASVVMGYYRELLRRLDGDTKADQVVIGTYPSADYPLVTLDATRPDGKVIFFFGEGIDRSSITDSTVTLLGPGGEVVPSVTKVFRGDTWANVLVVTANQDWQPDTEYTVILDPAIVTLNGESPGTDFAYTFKTCASVDADGNCPIPDTPAPTSGCPKTEEMYKTRPGEGGSGGSGGTGGTGGTGGSTKDPDGATSSGGGNVESSGGCNAGDRDAGPAWALSLLGLAAIVARRRRR